MQVLQLKSHSNEIALLSSSLDILEKELGQQKTIIATLDEAQKMATERLIQENRMGVMDINGKLEQLGLMTEKLPLI